MKFLILLSMVALAVAEETYSAKYDDLDIEAAIRNVDQLKGFYGCYMDLSPCSTDAMVYFKKVLPEAIQQSCLKCTPAQKHIMRRFVEELKENYPQEFGAFVSKFDPENKYFANLAIAIADA